MKVRIYGEEITCDKAVKGPDYVKLYTNGYESHAFLGISSFDGYETIEGEWSNPEPTPQEITQANVEKNLALSMFNAALLEDAINDLDNRLTALNV